MLHNELGETKPTSGIIMQQQARLIVSCLQKGTKLTHHKCLKFVDELLASL
jgi:hypothetical protein